MIRCDIVFSNAPLLFVESILSLLKLFSHSFAYETNEQNSHRVTERALSSLQFRRHKHCTRPPTYTAEPALSVTNTQTSHFADIVATSATLGCLRSYLCHNNTLNIKKKKGMYRKQNKLCCYSNISHTQH